MSSPKYLSRSPRKPPYQPLLQSPDDQATAMLKPRNDITLADFNVGKWDTKKFFKPKNLIAALGVALLLLLLLFFALRHLQKSMDKSFANVSEQIKQLSLQQQQLFRSQQNQVEGLTRLENLRHQLYGQPMDINTTPPSTPPPSPPNPTAQIPPQQDPNQITAIAGSCVGEKMCTDFGRRVESPPKLLPVRFGMKGYRR